MRIAWPQQRSWPFRIALPSVGLLRLLAIGLVLAGIVHICATFAMPSLSTSSAFRRFAATLPANRLELLPPVTPSSQPLPFLAPDARYAVCRFDTSIGSVVSTVTLPDSGWVLSLHTMQGENFYHVVGQAGKRITLSLLLVPPSDQSIGEAADTSASPAGAPVPVAARQGLLVVRAPERGFAFRQETEAELRKSRCTLRRAG